MLLANFTSINRVGDGVATVTFYDDSSGGIITNRKWIFGDGYVLDGNETTATHLYAYPGTYTVTLVVSDSFAQASVIKEGYVVVNEVHSRPSFNIAEGFSYSNDEYWRFYFDSMLHLVYEDKDYIYKSENPVTEVGKWTLVEFHAGSDRMYVGTYNNVRSEVLVAKSVNSSPFVLNENISHIARDSTIKIDELKVWLGDKRLSEYYYDTRNRAGYLDNL